MQINDFGEIWLVAFGARQPPGERPTPVRLEAREYRTGREIRLGEEEIFSSACPAYSVGTNALFVAYDAPAALGCHLALGWPLPPHVLDLHTEFRCLTSGLNIPGNHRLEDALAYFKLDGAGLDALAKLLVAMSPAISLGHALLRGRYTAAVARMEAAGLPIDVESLSRLREGWGRIQDALIERLDCEYGVFQGGAFNPRLWNAWVNRNAVPWPRQTLGRLDLRLSVFREMAKAYPKVRPMKELKTALSLLRKFRLAVGEDGRNRCPLRPFASKTGRNQPSTSEFIFGPAAWIRGLIKPAEGMALAYLDYEQQEFGIAAALSGDPAMKAAYMSGDPYLAFAKQAQAVPADATKATHRDERERFKMCALGVQYGMGAKSLAVRLAVPYAQAQDLLRLHRETYATYWRWSEEVGRQARRDGMLQASFGWNLHVARGSNLRSVRNFPLQANGAEMLRLACIVLTESGVRVCAPVHDALLVEAPTDRIEEAIDRCLEAMKWASCQVLQNFPLRTEVKIVRFPDRFIDDRGRAMWKTVFGLLDSVTDCARPAVAQA